MLNAFSVLMHKVCSIMNAAALAMGCRAVPSSDLEASVNQQYAHNKHVIFTTI